MSFAIRDDFRKFCYQARQLRDFLSQWLPLNVKFGECPDDAPKFVVSFKDSHPTAVFDAVSIKVKDKAYSGVFQKGYCYRMRLLKDNSVVYKIPGIKDGFVADCRDTVLEEIESLADINIKSKLYAEEGSSKHNPDDDLLKVVYGKMWDGYWKGYGAIRSRGTAKPNYSGREFRDATSSIKLDIS